MYNKVPKEPSAQYTEQLNQVKIQNSKILMVGTEYNFASNIHYMQIFHQITMQM